MLKVRKVFRQAVPQLTPDEIESLTAVIKRDGFREPVLCLPDGSIVDGHHRFDIAEMLGIEPPYEIREDLAEKSEDEIVLWIKERAVSQRNLSNRDRKLLLGEIYNREKRQKAGRPPKKEMCSNEHIKSDDAAEPPRTIEKVAKRMGASTGAVSRGAKLLTALESLSPGIQDVIRTHPAIASDAAILNLAGLSTEDRFSAWREVRVNLPRKSFDEVLKIKGGVSMANSPRATPKSPVPAVSMESRPKGPAVSMGPTIAATIETAVSIARRVEDSPQRQELLGLLASALEVAAKL